MKDKASLRNRRICCRTTRAVEAAIRTVCDDLHMNRSQAVHWMLQAQVHHLQYFGGSTSFKDIMAEQLVYEPHREFIAEVDKALADFEAEEVPW